MLHSSPLRSYLALWYRDDTHTHTRSLPAGRLSAHLRKRQRGFEKPFGIIRAEGSGALGAVF